MANALRANIGAPFTVTLQNSIANKAYSASGDKLHILNAGNAPVADFELTNITWASAPVTGSLVLVAIDRSAAGAVGPTPSSSMLGRTYPFNPQASTGNTSTGWVMTCPKVPLTVDCDYYVYNAETGVTLNAGAVLSAQPWTFAA